MGAGDLFRRLDRTLLPPVARRLARLGRGSVQPRLLTGVAVLSGAAVLLAAVWTVNQRPAAPAATGDVVRVGVVEGESIPGYVESSRARLAALLDEPPAPGRSGDQWYALVTLNAYLAPDRLTPILGGLAVAEVFARVPLPDAQTEIVRIPAFRVPADVLTGMEQVADRKDREALHYLELSSRLTGEGPDEAVLREVYDTGARVAAAEALAYRRQCSCVYAAVVHATPAALDQIAGRQQVRAVDPAVQVRRLDRAVFLPPLPEQEDRAHPPADRGHGPAGEAEPARGPAQAMTPGPAQGPAPRPGQDPAQGPAPRPGQDPAQRPAPGPAQTPATTGRPPSD